jgi:Transglycosylase SLT domain
LIPQLSALLTKLTISLGILSVALASAQIPSAVFNISPPPISFPDQASIRQYISREADYAGVPVSEALWIAGHESGFVPSTVGDKDYLCLSGERKGLKSPSYGIWQISTCFHPEVGINASLDVISSTAWALGYMRDHPDEWMTWLHRNDWFNEKL